MSLIISGQTFSSSFSTNTLINNTVASYTMVKDGELRVMAEYIDYIIEILGIDIDLEKFKEMSSGEKKKFLRSEKIKKIL